MQIDPADISSDGDNEISENPDRIELSGQFPSMVLATPDSTYGASSGDDIPDVGIDGNPDDEEFSSRSSSSRRGSRTRNDGSSGFKTEASSKPPTLDEWTAFFSRIVLRFGCEWYVNLAFRGIDEDMLSERELDRIMLTDEEKTQIAIPFAELSNKSRFMRKHGRTIVSSGASFQALVVLGMWMSRVNRIASKYRPKVVRGRMNGASPNGSNGQGTPTANGYEGTSGGRIPNGYPIFPGSG